jgi:putative ABC transport system permease protein
MNLLDEFRQDLLASARALRKRPAVMLTAMFTLALAIGATSAIFTVVNGVLLKPLGYHQPEQLVQLYRSQPPVDRSPVSRPTYLDFATRQQSLQDLAAHYRETFNLTANLTGIGAERLVGTRVTGNFFGLFGGDPLRGRYLQVGDDQPGSPLVAVIGEGLWRQMFGAAEDVVGRKLILNGQTHTIVGVAPAHHFPEGRQIWTPAVLAADSRGRGNNFLMMIGRLRAGLSQQQAETDLNQVAAVLAQEFPADNQRLRITVANLLEDQVRNVRSALWSLLAAVALVLLIACANVANLLLARATERQKEFAIRAALGAGVGRIVRQLLTESVLLALVSGLLGLLLASWGVGVLVSLAPEGLPRAAEIGLDHSVLAFGIGLSLLTGLVFGLAPAWQLARAGVNPVLKQGSRALAGSAQRSWLRRGLVVSEMALSLVLLMGAGMLLDGVRRLLAVDPGFSTENLVAADIAYARAPRPPDAVHEAAGQQMLRERAVFLAAVEQRVAALPGVLAVGSVNDLPVTGDSAMSGAFGIEGRPKVNWSNAPVAERKFVSASYFAAMGIPLRRGRAFDGREPPAGAVPVLINETLARRFFPAEDPLGKRLVVPGIAGTHEIIGVVGDARQQDLHQPATPELYFSSSQLPYDFEITLVARTESDPATLAPAIRGAIASVNPGAPVFRVRTMNQVMAQSVAQERFTTFVMGAFALMALLLAAVGLYGVMAYFVGQRRHEIGVRAALGAQARDLLQLIVGEGLKLALTGVAIGLVAGLGLRAWLGSVTFGLPAGRPATLLLVTLLLLSAALLASYLPARRAIRVEPVEALKQE